MRTVATALAAAFLLVTTAESHLPGGSPRVVVNLLPPPRPKFECASKNLNATELRQLQEVLIKADTSRNANDRSDTDLWPVKTHIHVVAASWDELYRFQREGVIDTQFSRLNRDYAQAGIKFSLRSSGWYVHPTWAHGQGEEQMQQALGKGGYDELNIYLISSLKMKPGAPTTANGYCSIPESTPSHKSLAFHGCMVMAETTIGDYKVDYGMGRVGVHEVGHWFGLLHTFEGGCVPDADGVPDTPPQYGQTDFCPASRPSCPGYPDLFAPYNIMDYAGE
ncbi:hypothetical protein L249_1856 [Ophiocordyceps polyrhachis-furcata BCC 54312]|uniref:Peptidase M43 pregnancy-associated plasma-A domain-containing protein n=1 Tax=Ophiocordyceps polyrhachis-furcata BCC 54312 TaxID=1330021 RepID=A0A367LPF1_9HYPO|nr:hypothetical protein L249_1856 [Ophiocordyceps polyrhachis-furcata BCC 54312]